MNKLWIAVTFFALLGIVVFVMAARLYLALVSLYPALAISRDSITGNDALGNVLLYLKVEIIALIVFGAVAWSIAGIFVVVIRKSKNLTR